MDSSSDDNSAAAGSGVGLGAEVAVGGIGLGSTVGVGAACGLAQAASKKVNRRIKDRDFFIKIFGENFR
jgi:hypothetical protein